MSEEKAGTRLGVKEWVFITSSIVTLLGGVGGTIGHGIFTQGDEVAELKKRITDVEKDNQKLWMELSRLGWKVDALTEQTAARRR